jgi:hypothetical protein
MGMFWARMGRSGGELKMRTAGFGRERFFLQRSKAPACLRSIIFP